MNKFAQISVMAAVAAFLTASPALAADPAPQAQSGQKLDSGLGQLPHYRYWADKTGKNPVPVRVVGEKLDSGLGDIQPQRSNRSTVEIAQRN